MWRVRVHLKLMSLATVLTRALTRASAVATPKSDFLDSPATLIRVIARVVSIAIEQRSVDGQIGVRRFKTKSCLSEGDLTSVQIAFPGASKKRRKRHV